MLGRSFGLGMIMVLFSLEARLALCASMVRPGAALADVGTDHAYLPVWLARRGLIRSAVASDVRPGPLERAEKNIERYGASGIVQTRLCNGLDGISPGEADDVVLAGMGGLLMAEIIGRAAWLKDGRKHLILQPMTRGEELRRSLFENGFSVLREQAVLEERRVYTVMLCEWGRTALPADELFPYIGLLNGDTPAGRAYLQKARKRLQNRAAGFSARGECDGAEELLRLREKIGALLAPRETEKKHDDGS